MIETALGIPSAHDVDFSDVDSVCGYQFMLCRIFGLQGGFRLPKVTNRQILLIQTQGLTWIREVKRLISDILEGRSMSLAAIPALLDSYDLIHRISKDAEDTRYIRDVRLRTVDRWLKGDKSIPRTDVVLEILKELHRDGASMPDRYATFALQTVGDWVDHLNGHGGFGTLPVPEIYDRLTCLIRTDLSAYLGSRDQNDCKRRWIATYTLTDEELALLDTPALWAYIAFARSASYFLKHPAADTSRQHTRLLHLLTSRPDLHPFYREAIELDLSEYRSQPA